MHYAVSQEQERMGDKARERKGKEEGRRAVVFGSRCQVLRLLTNGGEGAVMGLCYRTAGTGQYLKGTRATHIPETPAFPFHKGGRRGQLHTTPATRSSNDSLGSPCPLYHSHSPKVKSLELGLLRFPTHSYQTEATRQGLNTHL